MKMIRIANLKFLIFGILLFSTNAYSLPGTIDPRFGNNGWVVQSVFADGSSILDLEKTSDGKILALGNSGFQFAVARFHDNGILDLSFGQSGISIVTFTTLMVATKLLVQADGKILVLGDRNGDFSITRLNQDGSLDTNFGTSGSTKINVGPNGATGDLAYNGYELANGNLVIVGSANTQYNGIGIIRLLPNGTLDTNFGAGGKVQVTACFISGRCCYGTAAVPDDQGRIFVAGYACAARFLSNGAIDTSFGQQGVVEQPGMVVNNIWTNPTSYTLGRGFEIDRQS